MKITRIKTNICTNPFYHERTTCYLIWEKFISMFFNLNLVRQLTEKYRDSNNRNSLQYYLWRNRFWFGYPIDVKPLFIPVSYQSTRVVGTLGVGASPAELLKFLFIGVIPQLTVSCCSKLTHKRHNILRSVTHFDSNLTEWTKLFEFFVSSCWYGNKKPFPARAWNQVIDDIKSLWQPRTPTLSAILFWQYPYSFSILFGEITMSSTQTVTQGKIQASRTHDYLYGR